MHTMIIYHHPRSTEQQSDEALIYNTYLSSIDELVSQTLSNGLDVTEGSLTGTSAEQPDGLVHTAQRGHIHSLTTHSTSTANTGGVLTGSTVDDGIDQHL